MHPHTSNLTKVVYGDGQFVVCGQKYFYITSDGGHTWTERASAALMDSAAYGDGQFILTSSVHACTSVSYTHLLWKGKRMQMP